VGVEALDGLDKPVNKDEGFSFKLCFVSDNNNVAYYPTQFYFNNI
jgi:hypothetical protein